MKVCEYISRFSNLVISKTTIKALFSSQLTNGPDKLECLRLPSLSNLLYCNAIAYWAHSYVMKEMKGREYRLKSLNYVISNTGPHSQHVYKWA
jgi:hypothetical protein